MTRKHYAERRFWSKVEKTSACWLWTGSISKYGYGQIQYGGRGHRKVGAHRVAYELLRGPIPEGLVLDHLCRVRHCVNPDHLEPVSNRENLMRGIGVSGMANRKTHCPQGHPYSRENTYFSSQGHRECRTCKRRRNAIRRQSPAYKAEARERSRLWREANPGYKRPKNAPKASGDSPKT